MNDFTRDELEIIRHALRMDIAKGGSYEGDKYKHKNDIRHNLAFDKIQSMIDNYEAKTIEAWHCEKCGHVQ